MSEADAASPPPATTSHWRSLSTRERFWSAVGGVAILATFDVTLPVLAWQGQLTGDWLIKLLGLVVSWPAAAVLIACVVLPRFQAPITAYLARATDIKLFNALTVSAQQQPALPAPSVAAIAESVEVRDVVEATVTPAAAVRAAPPGNDTGSNSNAAAHFAEVARLTAEAQAWKHQFQNAFLVPRTQQLLFWIAQHSPTSLQAINNQLGALIAREQQAAMLSALAGAGYVQGDSAQISVTDEGRVFLASYAQHASTPLIPPPPAGLLSGLFASSPGSLGLGGSATATVTPASPPIDPKAREAMAKRLGEMLSKSKP